MAQSDINEYLASHFGVGIDEKGQYKMLDPLAGLTDDEKNTYNHIPVSERETYKMARLEARYGKDYFSHGMSDDRTIQQMIDEMSLSTKATTPGYLNMLSADDRTALLNDYMDWQINHTEGIYGYTDEALAAMDDSAKASAQTKMKSALTIWSTANPDSYKVWASENNVDTQLAGMEEEAVEPKAIVYGSKEYEEITGKAQMTEETQEILDANKAAMEAQSAEATGDGAEVDASQSGKMSFWDNIVNYASKAFLIAKEFIDEKAVPWFKSHVFQAEQDMAANAQKTAEEEEQKAAAEEQASNTDTQSERETPNIEETASEDVEYDGVG